MINRVRLPILLSAEQGENIFLCPRSRLRNWSRETGSAVPSRVSLLISIQKAKSGAYLRDSSRVPRRRLFILNRHTPSGQSRVYQVTPLRTDDVRCRESADTGSVNLNVVPNRCCLDRSPWTNEYAPLFPTPTIGMKWAC